MYRKSIFFSLITAGLLAVGCGGSDASKQKGPDEVKPAAAAEDPEIKKGLQLIAQSDCLTCHAIKDQVNGPAYEEIAKRYENNPATIDSLAGKIIKGGAGNWGPAAMTAHPDLSVDDARTMVKYVLSLKP